MRKSAIKNLIKQIVNDFFSQQTFIHSKQTLITISNVDLSPDGRDVKLYLSFLFIGKGSREEQKKCEKELFSNIELSKWELKKYLVQHIGKKVRVIPDISFILDQMAENMIKIDRILEKNSNQT